MWLSMQSERRVHTDLCSVCFWQQVRRAEEERLRQLLVVAPETPSEEAWSFKGLFL